MSLPRNKGVWEPRKLVNFKTSFLFCSHCKPGGFGGGSGRVLVDWTGRPLKATCRELPSSNCAEDALGREMLALEP